MWSSETKLRPYSPVISAEASQVLNEMSEKYGRMNYTLFELIWLADIFADRRLSSSFEGAELPHIFSAFGSRYVVNKSALFRYARRRGVAAHVRTLLEGVMA